MGLKISVLYAAPEVNPINRKARSIPVFNVVNMYGRVFFFAWFSFMIAFWAWYTFPPLLTATIKADLHLAPAEVANSNIVSLCATLLIRGISGPLCDRFGPRKVFVGLMLIGSLPLGLAPLVQNATGLYISRFFIGILGGTFVPCLVWSTGFFDKNIVGTANALTGGFGNAGGGITYFIMPAVYDSLVASGYAAGPAWRITFIVPLVMVIVCALGLFFLCPDTPDGRWEDRALRAQQHLQEHGLVVDVPGGIAEKDATTEAAATSSTDDKKFDHEAQVSKDDMLETAQGEIIRDPTWRGTLKVVASPQTIFHIVTYLCSFGGELAINAILASYYLKNFPKLGQTGAANWAAMFGFLNFVTRPLGGVVSDILYDYCGRNLWLKKGWVVVCGVLTGVLLVIIGQTNPHDQSTMFGLIALMAIFLEAGNGANFSLVPHVHPHANGIVSGFTGAAGNMGGVIFAVIFRFLGSGTDYANALWVIGVMHIGLNLAVSWIPPIPKGQIGGH